MARTFIKGHEVENKDDFDKKINIENSLYGEAHNSGDLLKTFKATVGTPLGKLKSLRIMENPYNGNGILFGRDGAEAILEVEALTHSAIIIESIDNGKSITWQEELAFKSDIKALQDRVSALEKQIGGVLSSLLSHLVPRKVAC